MNWQNLKRGFATTCTVALLATPALASTGPMSHCGPKYGRYGYETFQNGPFRNPHANRCDAMQHQAVLLRSNNGMAYNRYGQNGASQPRTGYANVPNAGRNNSYAPNSG